MIVRIKKSCLLNCAMLFIVSAYSQNSPISESANSMVNTLTGDFNYSLPVMTVPSPNGENVPVVFNYSGGIQMDQESSWIGLGWSYNPGEISRKTKGVSDDWKNKSVTTTNRTSIAQNAEVNSYFGPLYFKDVNYNSSTENMDVGSSFLEFTSNRSFNSPNYDEFNVSGPGISGTLEFKLFDYASFHLKSKIGSYNFNDGISTDGEKNFTKTPNLFFTDDINSSISSPGSMLYVSDDFVTGFTRPQSTTNDYSGAYSSTTNRAFSSNFVEYFTNGNINSNYSALKANGFMDYRIVSGTRRPLSEFDSDGIGAIRITTPDGVVYHYSLPVYSYNEKSISFILDGNWDVNNSEEYTEVEQNEKSAVSWKLTAITGIDYLDVNNNGIVDIGDSGYWVAYNYGKWTDAYSWKFPYFNYKQGQFNKKLPTNYFPANQRKQLYKNQGTVSSGMSQIYYLNSIQTSTHTAFFIKSARLDGHSIDDGGGYTPQLRLDRIILMNNEDISLLDNAGTFTCDNRFTLTNCYVSNVVPHIGNYLFNEAYIKAKSLSTVEMDYDYSLCKMLYNNINNSFATSNATYHFIPTNFYYILYEKVDEATGATTTDNLNSGKLTLNKVNILGFGTKPISPPYLFDYDKNNSLKNPNYSVFKFDWWGFYKSDFNFNYRGHHTTENSKVNTDAWSLKRITTPLGGEINVEYESNNYRKIYNGLQFASPQRLFIIESGSSASGSNDWSITLNREVSDFINKDSVFAKEVFMPYFAVGQTTGCTQKIMLSEFGRYPSINAYPSMQLTLTNSQSRTYTYTATNLFGAPYSDTYPGCNYNISKDYSPNTMPLVGDVPLGYGVLALSYSSIQGGGVRVKSISFKDTESNLSYFNEYSYESGVCGSEPSDLLVFDDFATTTNDKSLDPFSPGSGISYSKVTVKSKSLNNTYNGKSVYEYNNLVDPITGFYADEGELHNSSGPSYTYLKANFKLLRLHGLFGSLKQFSIFDNNNNIISQEEYEYTTDASVPGVSESFHTAVLLPTIGAPYYYDFVLMTNYVKVDKNARLKRKTTYLDGIRTVYEPISYDAITGSVIKSRILDPTEGATIITETPAYTQSQYSSMGAKSVNVSNKNLLNINYKSVTERDKLVKNINNDLIAAGNPEIIDGTKTTFQQNYPKRVFDNSTNRFLNQIVSSSYWLPYKSFTFNGDNNDANWREIGEVTIFDKRLNVLESRTGVSNRFYSTKFGYDQKIKLVQANDSRFVDFTFSSFEDQENTSNGLYFGGEINNGQTRFQGDAIISPHTGKYLSKVDATNYGPTYLAKGITTNRTYRVSVWVHKNSPANAQLVANIDGSLAGIPYSENKFIQKSDVSNVTVGDWILMTLTIDVPKTYTESGGPSGFNDLRFYLYNPGGTVAYFDDFMVRPIDVDIVGNVVDEVTGRMVALIDKYGFGVKYVYDDAGRIREIWSESAQNGWILKTRNTYNFKRTF